MRVAPFRGYVLDIGPVFFLIALVSDRIWFDGFECFRIGDALGIRYDPYTGFVEAALAGRGEQKPAGPDVSLASLTELLLSSNNAFPLVTIHHEESDPDVCHIGCVISVGPDRVFLHEISPDATWEESPTGHPLEGITRVNFGGDYENALHLVGSSLQTR